MDNQAIITEFLIESAEKLVTFEQEMVELEHHPHDAMLLASIFRSIHTIKGNSGMLGFPRLEKLAHATETLLGEVRDKKREFECELTSVILDSIDGIKRILSAIEASGTEGEAFEEDLIVRLESKAGRSIEVAHEDAGTFEIFLPELTPVEEEAPCVEPIPPAVEASATPPEHPVQVTSVEAPDQHAKAGSLADTTLRIDVGLLDRLMNLVGELVLTRNQVLQYSAMREDSALSAITQRLNLITSELQEGVMKTRMQPIGVVWNKLPRLVRDISNTLGKDITLEMDGADTELDRAIIEAIKDPLIHIVRNSCDHGIESAAVRQQAGKPGRGSVSLRAFHEGGQVNIEISDDGGGIDPQRVKRKAQEVGLISADQAQRMTDRDAVNLVFAAGFSTAASITNISGRGVGMDVVKTHIERIGGTIELNSRVGQGTTVRVKIPLTLAIIPGLMISAGGERFVIPQISLHELIRLEGTTAHTRIEYIQSVPVYRRRDALLPLADLSKVLGLVPQRDPDEVNIVVLQTDEHRFGLIVDSISDSQEIVVKPLGQQLKSLNCYAGATILGDGRIALILDVTGIALRSGVIAPSGEGAHVPVPAVSINSEHDRRGTLLFFRAGNYQRIALPLSEVARLEKIPRSRLERASGRSVVQYRNRILPLLSLTEALGEVADHESDDLHVIVYSGAAGTVGLVVDEIIDIVEESVTGCRGSERAGLLGSAVVGGQVTDFLDINTVLQFASMPSSESLERLESAIAGYALVRGGEVLS